MKYFIAREILILLAWPAMFLSWLLFQAVIPRIYPDLPFFSTFSEWMFVLILFAYPLSIVVRIGIWAYRTYFLT